MQAITAEAGGAALLAVGAVLIRWLLDGWLGERQPFATLYAAIAVAVWIGGWRPAAWVGLLGFLACDYLFTHPRGAIWLADAQQVVGFLLFVLSGCIIVGFGESRRLALQRAEQQQRESIERQEQLGREAAERRRAQSRLQLISDTLPALVSYVGADGCYTMNNKAYESWFGHPRQQILGKHIREVLGEQAWRTIRPHVERALAGHVVHFETRAPYRHGGPRWIDASYVPDIAADGTVRGFVELVNDVSSRKEMEDSLRRSEERFRALIDHSWDGIVVVSTDGTIEFLSSSIERILGYQPQELLGEHIFLLLHADDRDAGEQAITELIAQPGHSTQHTFRFQHRNGAWRRMEGVAVNLVENSAIRGIVVNFRDVTERIEAERALRRSERLYRAIGESIDYGVWVCDPKGKNIYASESFLRLVGMTQEEFSEFGWSKVLHPDDAEPTVAAWQECVRALGTWDMELRYRGVDGRYHPVLARGNPVRDERGRVLCWAGINLDISRLKDAEDALRQADRRKDEFLATLAHELRNPLAPIRNAVQLLRVEADPSPAAGTARDIIDRQVEHLVRLIDDLLDISRITRNNLQLRKGPIDLADAIQAALETSRPIVESSGHTLHVALPDEPIPVEADLTRLAQVFANLLNNAAKYTDPGGRIELSAVRQRDEVTVAVSDTGIGIAAEQLPQIFEMFSQVTPALERSQGGLGIGLSLVRGLVEMHGGSVLAQSAGVGQGSTFLVRLPVLTAQPPLAEPLASETPGNGHAPCARRILVVDDNRDAARTLGMLLRMSGHEIESAHDGQEAIDRTASFLPDVILLDIGLPKLNGYEVARHIREQAWGQDITIVALTGWGQDDDKRRAYEAGCDHHLTKPVDLPALERLLADVAAESATV